ncbi:MAG: ATP-binding cassette domain-containing protein [Firmicutes bacterium]|jgi:zinc/manganese transport system ATP-binding protein|nr:ATP-binding cassette domain-containing protein [Bacillota bacterium]MCL5066402.1 ATP-binding cassette domain-containing protein [Bacillota bacterium]
MSNQEVNDRIDAVDASSGHLQSSQALPVLSISDLLVAYDTKVVLNHINLSLRAGELIGMIGPNGAGKSTLLRTIAGLIRPQKGTITFPGLDRGDELRHRKMTKVGYVPQRFDIDPDLPLRARDLVGLGWDGHRWGVPGPSRLRKAAVDKALTLVDALSFADAPCGRLSGGQLQRILIAQAMVSDPPLLLLDEPLASLDLRSADAIVEVVDRVAHETGVTVLLVTHDMNPLLRAMDRIIYVVNGNAVIGSVEDVVKKDVLGALYGYEVEVIQVRGRILVVGDDAPVDLSGGLHHMTPRPEVPEMGSRIAEERR